MLGLSNCTKHPVGGLHTDRGQTKLLAVWVRLLTRVNRVCLCVSRRVCVLYVHLYISLVPFEVQC